jgi:hypothetical protein
MIYCTTPSQLGKKKLAVKGKEESAKAGIEYRGNDTVQGRKMRSLHPATATLKAIQELNLSYSGCRETRQGQQNQNSKRVRGVEAECPAW